MDLFSKKKDAKSSTAMNASLNDSFSSLHADSRFANESALSILTKRKSRKALRRHWKAVREAKVVRKSAKYVDKYVSELTDGLPFLQNTSNQPIAKFRRSEIVVGPQLGKGVFARVYDIKDFDLQEELEGDLGDARLDLIQEFGNDSLLESNQLGLSRELNNIPENSNQNRADEGDGEEGARSDLVSVETSSTDPPSAPSTPPLTPLKNSIPLSNQRGSIRASMKSSMRSSVNSTSYRSRFLSDSELKREQSPLRLQVRDDLRNGKTNYALKHLTNTLLRNPKDFYLAAAALLIEAKYLAKMNHPNIIKVKGLAMGSNSGVGASTASRRFTLDQEDQQEGLHSISHCDSYFLFTERLTGTLDQRIRQWKKDSPTHKKISEQSSEQKVKTWKLMMRKTSYALQISNALHYLHQRNLLYRDLKPQNIGFVGDNQTIAIFNFGLCREVNPDTKSVTEDEITAMYGVLSWRYTAVECFSQEIYASIGGAIMHGKRLISNSTRSSRLDLSGSGSGLFAKYSRHKKENVPSLGELERELQNIQEHDDDDDDDDYDDRSQISSASAPQASKVSSELNGLGQVKPAYDMKVDVYSWAMVYYEMLTTNPPFAKMTQREHYRNVCGKTMDGYEGGQRPGIYQYDLTPSMISLLQRAWDQTPSKRPTMKSVGTNLQTILRELEEMIKDEQKKMALAISAGEEGTGQFLVEQQQLQNLATTTTPSRHNTSGGIFKGGVFAKKKKAAPPTSAVAPLPAAGTTAKPKNDSDEADDASSSEVDLAGLEYENWDDVEEVIEDESESDMLDDEEESLMSVDEEGTGEGTSSGANTGSPALTNNKPRFVDDSDGGDDGDVDPVEGATVAMQEKRSDLRSEGRSILSRTRTNSNQGGNLRRMRSKSTSPRAKTSRRLDSEYFERRATNRMSRRTIRLSRQSMWLLREGNTKAFVLLAVAAVLVLVGSGALGYMWYQRRQRFVLGVHLDELRGLNSTEAMTKLDDAIKAKCQREIAPIEDLSLPMLFKGGALTPYDEDCISQIQKEAQEEIAFKLNLTNEDDTFSTEQTNTSIDTNANMSNGNSTAQVCGFLKMHNFDAPPPTKKKRESKWRRKKPWKFFRDS